MKNCQYREYSANGTPFCTGTKELGECYYEGKEEECKNFTYDPARPVIEDDKTQLLDFLIWCLKTSHNNTEKCPKWVIYELVKRL